MPAGLQDFGIIYQKRSEHPAHFHSTPLNASSLASVYYSSRRGFDMPPNRGLVNAWMCIQQWCNKQRIRSKAEVLLPWPLHTSKHCAVAIINMIIFIIVDLIWSIPRWQEVRPRVPAGRWCCCEAICIWMCRSAGVCVSMQTRDGFKN